MEVLISSSAIVQTVRCDMGTVFFIELVLTTFNMKYNH